MTTNPGSLPGCQLCWTILFALCAFSAGGFDQDHRIDSLVLQGGTDSFATNNAFGAAFSQLGRQQVQSSIDSSLVNGSLSILLGFPGLVDLRGSNAASMAVGLANAAPVLLPGNPTNYSGLSDLDWWYIFNPGEVDHAGNALQQLPASIVSGVLNAGPGQLTFPNTLFGGSGMLSLRSTFIRANVGASSAPLRSTNNFPPGHRQNLDPALVAFATLEQGQMRGTISAAVLASLPVPASLTSGATMCNQGYVPDNTMLDVIVGGCTVLIIPIVATTQPDQFDPSAPALGAGPPYIFTRTGTRVTAARDRNGAAVNLQDALNASAYSSYFTLTTTRIIAFTKPSVAPTLTDVTTLPNGAFHFRFTNAPRASFSVLSAPQAEWPTASWTVIGVPTQPAPGLYEFVDPGVSNQFHRFYQVRSP